MAHTLTTARDFLYSGDHVPKGTKVEYIGRCPTGLFKVRMDDDFPLVHNASRVFLLTPDLLVEDIAKYVKTSVIKVTVNVTVQHEEGQDPFDVISECNYEFAIEPDEGKQTPLIVNTELVEYHTIQEDNDG